VLTLGLATDEAFLPLDSQIYISDTKAHSLIEPYKDGRSIGAKRYQEAVGQTKVQMAVGMMRRAVRAGISADYIAADAWFGNKELMRAAISLEMTAILRMKRNKLKYRVTVEGNTQLLDAKELYQQAVRKQWKKVRGIPWKAVEMIVEVDLATEKGKDKPAEYHEVKLLFVRGINEEPDVDGSRKDWALFLSTDPLIGTSTMLEAYALRWSIEVYFKEAKQHLGFLKEQTITFVSHTASIHLCAIRYLMLMNGKLNGPGSSLGELRENIQDQLNSMCFATHLWQIFRAIVGGTLKSLSKQLGCSVSKIMKAIDTRVEEFFVSSLQLDALTMELEHE
jgi:SRSO17 transposase